jgi:light-regulated signal transduction histidine kinase (bacteriophytochrome)
MLTAVEDREAMIESLSAGADDYISKSSDFEVLKARLRSQIRRRQVEEEHHHLREQLLHSELEAAESRAARELAETRATLVAELERKNAELETFSYSVSHDLRAPLRAIDGFSQALLEDYSEKVDAKGQDYLRRVRAAAQRMGVLIDDLLELSRVGRSELRRERTDLSTLARSVAAELEAAASDRRVEFVIPDGLVANADSRLLRIVFQNLLGNAWKFTGKSAKAVIEVGATSHDGHVTYFVRDNGVGFDMAHAKKLFTPFQRLHSEAEFPGTGIGLATVQRIVDRHGGTVRAEAETGRGATIWFTI